MVRVARFVLRDSGDPAGSNEDGLLIGSLFRNEGPKWFKPGYVYEIQECLGELVIHEVGPSWIKPSCKSGRTATYGGETFEVQNQCCWSNEIGSVLSVAGKSLVLSEDEYLSLCQGNHD